MAGSNEESEEIKTLTKTQLASITWPLKTPKDQASYMAEFSNHIKNKFRESPTQYQAELQEFSNIRNIAISSLGENSIRDNNSLLAIKRYYCVLLSMLSRFRDSKAEFSWKDSFGRGYMAGGLDFELNSIMYNIASFHSEFGSKISRTNENSNRDALSHFTAALWWVTELRDNRAAPKSKEMGHDLLTFFHHILRAQSQECVLSHSLSAGMKPESIAKIAAQVASDYEIAAKLAQAPLYTDPLREILNGASILHNWRATVEFKQNYYSAITNLMVGLTYKDDNAKEIGLRIARLKKASTFLVPCKKLIQDTLENTNSRLAFEELEKLANRKLEKSSKYNDNVYHASVPNIETLPPPEAKLLISPAAFSKSSVPGVKDLFSSLVTIENIQTSSIYSQKKDELMRRVKEEVSEKDEDLARMMSSLNIDKRTLRLPSFGAPEELLEICAELSTNPGIVDDVLTKLEDLDDKSEEIQKMLDSLQKLLAQRPHPQHLEELNRYRKTHEDALKTTQTLHKQLYPELQKTIHLMATTEDPMVLLPKVSGTSAQDEETIRKLEKLIDKVDEMKQQRATLLNQLKMSVDDDDVTKHVVTASDDQDLNSVFEKEIEKHSKYKDPLKANLDIQNEMLNTLESVNAQYGEVRLSHRRQRAAYMDKVESLKKIYTQFKTVCDGIDQGVKYQNSMLGMVRNFYSKVQANNSLNDLLN